MKKMKLLTLFCILLLTALLSQTQETVQAKPDEFARICWEIQENGLAWKAGPTSMLDIQPAERRNMAGAVVPLADDPKAFLPRSARSLTPSTLDWRNVDGINWLTAIKNQGSCGSCWAFGAIGTLEAVYRIERNLPNFYPDLSEQHIVSCSGAGTCKKGGSPYSVLQYIKSTGVPLETEFQYTGRDIPCTLTENWEYKVYRLDGLGYVTQSISDNQAIIDALQDHPLTCYFKLYDDFYYYQSGIYETTPSAKYEGGHIVVLVGYNSSERYWLCKNSWGARWGEQGYFKIRWDVDDIGKWVIAISDIYRLKKGKGK